MTFKRVFITGASGFIGAALAERFAALGAAVRGVDVRADPARAIVAGDIAEPDDWQDHAAGCDLVIHTAAIVSMRGGDPGGGGAVWRTNALGTRHVLDAACRAGAARVVHLSSVTVFGFAFPDGVDESYPTRPNGVAYVDTKVAAEALVAACACRRGVTTREFFGFYARLLGRRLPVASDGRGDDAGLGRLSRGSRDRPRDRDQRRCRALPCAHRHLRDRPRPDASSATSRRSALPRAWSAPRPGYGPRASI